MEKQKYYRFGLDIGIGSVGWAVLECNENGENIELVKAGVRIFNVAETEKNESLAAARRIARSARRRNRRHKFRLERARQLIVSTGILTQVELDELYSIHTKKENIYEIRYNALEHKLTNAQFAKLLIHYLQRRGYNCKGRDQYKIDKLKEELQDCNNTTAKSQTDEQKSLRGIASNSKIVESKKYRTVGEMIYKDDKFVLSDVSVKDKKIFKARNSPNDYKFVMLREWIVDEIRCVFECQKKLNNGFATDEICQDYLKIFEGQRDYAQGPGGDSLYGVSGYNKRVSEYNKKVLQSDKPKISVLWDKRVGKCTFELDQDRAERSSYSFEKFRLYQDLNHIKILNMTDGTVKPLNQEQWDKLYEMAHTKVEFKYKDIRKKLNLNDEQKFSNLDYKDKKKKGDTTKPKDPEMTKFKGLPCYHKIASALKNSGKNMDDFKEFLDPIARILTKFKDSDDKLVEQELQKLVDSEQELKKLVEGSEIVLQLAQIDDFPSGFGHLSVKAINKILPHWTPGLTYDKACEKAEYDFKAEGEKIRVKKLELIKHAENDGKSPISNPIVRRSTSQTIKVVNALIQQYTSPIAINIELAREMAKSADERKRIANEQSENRNNNEGIKNYIKKDLNKSQPGGIDIQKVKLFREQRGLCMYSGVHIKEEDLLKDGYVEIDHIVPYSVSFNDSYKNKVLVLAAENQQKGNRLPLEYLDGQKKEQFICNVNRIYERNFEKKARLLKLEITQEDRQNFIDRNLNDTRYATKLIANMFKKYLQFSDAPNFKDDDGANRSRVLSVNGTMTSFIRSRFGFNKIREAGDTHHALDAIVVGCTTQSYISQISRHYKKLENGQRKHDMEAGKFIDFGTGEVLEHQEYIQRGLDKRQVSHKLKKDLDKQHFDSEFSPLKNVNATIFRENVENLITKSQGLHDCAEDKIFVSRKPTRKVSGQAHKDTVYGKVKVENHNGKFDSTKRFKTTKLQALKLNKNKDKIEGYSDTIFAKSDQILHKALIDKLIEYNGDAEKAFKKPFFKPIIDKKGNKIEDGNLVKSVKCIESTNLNLELRGGLAANGDMIRIDVFKIGDKLTPDNDAVKKDLGYYFVPIYVYDTVKKELPNKAVVAKKPYEEWKEMKETDFLFSLYPNDLVYMENKGKKGHFYYNGADISSGTIGLLSHDRSQLKSDGKDWDGRIGLKTLQTIKKCEVDVLGKITSIKAKQVRQTFDKKSSLV